jgi:hypothetical protein
MMPSIDELPKMSSIRTTSRSMRMQRGVEEVVDQTSKTLVLCFSLSTAPPRLYVPPLPAHYYRLTPQLQPHAVGDVAVQRE